MIQGLTLKSGWLWLALVAAVAHSLFVPLIAALPFISPLFVSGDHTHFLDFWVTVLVSHWTVTLIIVACLRLSGAGPRAIGLCPPRPGILLLLLLVGVGIGVAIQWMPVHTSSMKQPVFPTLPWTHSERYFMLLFGAPTAAICEETIYRGFIFRFLAKPIGIWPAMIVQALLFAYMHGGLKQPLWLFLNGSIIGFLLALLVNWRGNLRAAMVVHFLIDAVQFPLVPV